MICRNQKMIFYILLFFVVECNFKIDAQETTTAPPETTTYEPETTTEYITDPPLGSETLDFKFSSLVSGFNIDVNFTEIPGSESSFMSMYIETPPDSQVAKDICNSMKSVGLYYLQQSSCSVSKGSVVPAEEIGKILKTNGNIRAEVPFTISELKTFNCMVVGTTVSEEEYSTSTAAPPASTTAVIATTGVATGTSAPRSSGQRQLIAQPGMANLGIGTSEIEKHQYDVKKIAEQVDNGTFINRQTTSVGGTFPEDNLANLADYYDPEDLIEDNGVQVLGVGDEPEDDLATLSGLDNREIALFRQSGCTAKRILNQIPLFIPTPRRQSRIFGSLVFLSVFSTGTVYVQVAGSSNSPSPTFVFISPSPYNFNPFATWPQIVLQGSYLWATYGSIIAWALILGAIVWAIAIGNSSGFFSTARLSYVERNMIYGPLERLTDLVHTGIEKFTEFNRRNTHATYHKYTNRRNSWSKWFQERLGVDDTGYQNLDHYNYYDYNY